MSRMIPSGFLRLPPRADVGKISLICLSLFGLLGELHAQFDLYYGIPSQLKRNHAIGVSMGSGIIWGDIPWVYTNFNGGLYYQRRLNRVVDVRIDVKAGRYEGEDTGPSRGFLRNPTLNGTNDPLRFYDSTQLFFQNFRTEWGSGTIGLKFNINRMIARSGSDRWDLYLLAAVGAFAYDTRMDAFDNGTSSTYAFRDVPMDNIEATRSALQNLRDKRYETEAEEDELNSSQIGTFVWNTTFLGGIGGHISLNRTVGIGLEGTIQGLGDDLVDGQQWTEVDGEIVQSLDRDNLIQVSFMIDFAF